MVVDWLSKQPLLIPCYKTTNAKDIVELFITHIYYHYGVLDFIVSDRGPQFILDFWNEFCHILGVKLKFSMAYYALTNR
jgi:hypothetical protein